MTFDIFVTGPLLPLAALIWPLLIGALAAVPQIRAKSIRLLPLAPIPALGLAVVLAWRGVQEPTRVSDLLLGVVLGAEAPAALLLGTTAILWFAAAIFAQRYMRGTSTPAVFSGFWCLTLTGNIGVFIAADVVTFYVSFAAVSLAAYFLVVHENTAAALRAGRIYAVLVILGEVCLLLGFVIGVAAADSFLIVDIRAALPGAPLSGLAMALLVAGFGVKAGLMPLHVWLPLAHPAAPTPASAVLSGAIVKAGIIGMMLFLPGGATLGAVLVVMGFFTTFVAALLGLTQSNPKAILAYSTISQMGLMIALVGAALQGTGDMTPVAFYAAHHGLAKGALFLSVGLVAAAAGRWRIGVVVGAALVALSVSGAPLSGGALAKAAAKPGVGDWAMPALTLSAVTTTLILMWFLLRLSRSALPERPAAPAALLWVPTLALGLGALVLPWMLWSDWTDLSAGYPLRPASLWAAFWPVALGLGLAFALLWRGRHLPTLPQGDIVVLLIRGGAALISLWTAAVAASNTGRTRSGARLARSRSTARRMIDHAAQAETALQSWRISGLIVMALIVVVALAGLA